MTLMTRRVALAVVASSVLANPGRAEVWPNRTVRLITSAPPGGSPDMVARLFGERLAKHWNQGVVVENRPGADGILAVRALREAAGTQDNHALLVAPATIATVTPALKETLPFDPVEDLRPISTAATDSLAIAVPQSSQVTTLSDLLERAKTAPNRLNWYAVPGGPFLLFSDWLRRREAALIHVPYRGGPDAIRDLIESRIDVVMAPLLTLLPFVESGKVRLLAVNGEQRAALAPTVPTVREAGHADLTLEGVIAFFGPRGLDAAVRNGIAKAISLVSQDHTLAEALRRSGQILRTDNPETLSAYLAEQRDRWQTIARSLPVKPP